MQTFGACGPPQVNYHPWPSNYKLMLRDKHSPRHETANNYSYTAY